MIPLTAEISAETATPESTPAAWLSRIACITSSRADSGIYRSLWRALEAQKCWQTSLLVGGTHHDEHFGATGDAIAGLPNTRVVKIRHFARGDTPEQVSRTAGQAVIEFSRALSEVRPDLIFVLGDRTEVLAAALAALIHRVPIAHLHGGDVTEGAYDDSCRNAITKLSHLHFPALPEHGERIARMGEDRWRIHAVGALALDELSRFQPAPEGVLRRMVGLDFSNPTIVVAFHPETLSAMPVEKQIEEVLSGLCGWDGPCLLIGPNADVGREAINGALHRFAASRPETKLAAHLPQPLFWSCVARSRVLVGNSSAGIIEAASLRIPVVDVGDRQKGRSRAANVLHAPIDRHEIALAIKASLDPTMRHRLSTLVNPYGDGRTAERIVTFLQTLPDRDDLLLKAASPH
jgi:UDP-hydrolysing UDP-N-acetyl-D-glucosamine 2-epimerase